MGREGEGHDECATSRRAKYYDLDAQRESQLLAAIPLTWLTIVVTGAGTGVIIVLSNHTRSNAALFASVIFCGGIGAAIGAIANLTAFLGNKRFQKSWTAYFLYRPVVGAGIAGLLYVLFRAVFTSSTAQPQDLNLYGLMSAALLVGFGSKTVIDRLALLFTSIKDRAHGESVFRSLSAARDGSYPKPAPLSRYRGYLVYTLEPRNAILLLTVWLQTTPSGDAQSQLIDVGEGAPAPSVTYRAMILAHNGSFAHPKHADITWRVRDAEKPVGAEFYLEGVEGDPQVIVEVSQRGRTVAVLDVSAARK